MAVRCKRANRKAVPRGLPIQFKRRGTASNGKLERWHGTIKTECIRPGTPLSLEDALRLVTRRVEHDNHVRLHSALGYATPAFVNYEEIDLGGGITVHGAARDWSIFRPIDWYWLTRCCPKTLTMVSVYYSARSRDGSPAGPRV